MSKLWIVTRAENQYDQMGEYFVGGFIKKPSFQDLKKMMPDLSDVVIGKLTRGGGRQDAENTWYYLNDVDIGIEFNKH